MEKKFAKSTKATATKSTIQRPAVFKDGEPVAKPMYDGQFMCPQHCKKLTVHTGKLTESTPKGLVVYV
jgi:hypothetical protein